MTQARRPFISCRGKKVALEYHPMKTERERRRERRGQAIFKSVDGVVRAETVCHSDQVMSAL
jgi:hypothetical protein